MIRATAVILFATAASLASLPATAQDAMQHTDVPPSCAVPGTLPPALAGWAASHSSLNAVAKPRATRAALLMLGHAADSTLLPTPAVRYAVPPAKPGGSVSFGGLFAFEVAEAGTYRVSLSTHSWTDVIEGGKALLPVAHGHGPECTSLAKMVDYELKPGHHTLRIAANGEPGISIMVSRLP
jgi:hypothetical protein